MENNKIAEILQACVQSHKKHSDKLEKMEKKKSELEGQLKRLKDRMHKTWNSGPNYFNSFIDPLAKELVKATDAEKYEVFGPCGLDNRITLDLYYLTIVKTIEFRIINAYEGKFAVADYSTDTKEFAPGTVGYVNGMNLVSHPIPEDATVEWIMQYSVSMERDRKDVY